MLPAPVSVPATPAIQAADIRTFYNLEDPRIIGKGGFSEVVAARHKASGTIRALKIMKRESLVGKKAEMVTHEREILRRTNHPCIITLHETIITDKFVFLALDCMSGDLFDFIIANQKISEPLSRKILHQILSGILYLHQQSITHRDIKPENILLNCFMNGKLVRSDSFQIINMADPDTVDFQVKIADFGLAKLILEYDVKNTPCGTSYYLAPEIIRGIEEQGTRPLCTNCHLVKSIDVWSCGVLFYVLLSGRPPFSSHNVRTSAERRDMLHLMDRGVLFNPSHGWDSVSEEAKDLIVKMLEQDISKRITAQSALNHSFFTQNGFPTPIIAPPPPYLGPRTTAPSTEPPKHRFEGIFSAIKQFRTRTPEQRVIMDEISALQKGQVEDVDKDGETTIYTSSMHIHMDKPPKPAVMNTKLKVGPDALRK